MGNSKCGEKEIMHLAVASLKGGVGKTTTAIHLAAYLQQDQPTLLIDADRNRSALVWAKEDKLPFMVASQAGAVAIIARYTHIIIDMRGGQRRRNLWIWPMPTT